MSILTDDPKKISQETLYKLITEALEFPTPSKPLSGPRKWSLPCPDSRALADYPGDLKILNAIATVPCHPAGQTKAMALSSDSSSKPTVRK